MAQKKQGPEEEPKRRKRRGIDQRIAELEAKIAAIRQREAQRKAKADPALRHASAAVRAIDKALEAAKDAATKRGLNEARAVLGAVLAGDAADAVAAPRARRSSAETEDLAEMLLSYVRGNPGQRSEQIAAALATDTDSLRPVMKRLISEGKVATEGQRRGMTYSAV